MGTEWGRSRGGGGRGRGRKSPVRRVPRLPGHGGAWGKPRPMSSSSGTSSGEGTPWRTGPSGTVGAGRAGSPSPPSGWARGAASTRREDGGMGVRLELEPGGRMEWWLPAPWSFGRGGGRMRARGGGPGSSFPWSSCSCPPSWLSPSRPSTWPTASWPWGAWTRACWRNWPQPTLPRPAFRFQGKWRGASPGRKAGGGSPWGRTVEGAFFLLRAPAGPLLGERRGHRVVWVPHPPGLASAWVQGSEGPPRFGPIPVTVLLDRISWDVRGRGRGGRWGGGRRRGPAGEWILPGGRHVRAPGGWLVPLGEDGILLLAPGAVHLTGSGVLPAVVLAVGEVFVLGELELRGRSGRLGGSGWIRAPTSPPIRPWSTPHSSTPSWPAPTSFPGANAWVGSSRIRRVARPRRKRVPDSGREFGGHGDQGPDGGPEPPRIRAPTWGASGVAGWHASGNFLAAWNRRPPSDPPPASAGAAASPFWKW
jgi:hypothetical protein